MNSRSTRKDARLQSWPRERINVLLFGHIAVTEEHHELYVETMSESIAPYPQVSSTPRSASCGGQPWRILHDIRADHDAAWSRLDDSGLQRKERRPGGHRGVSVLLGRIFDPTRLDTDTVVTRTGRVPVPVAVSQPVGRSRLRGRKQNSMFISTQHKVARDSIVLPSLRERFRADLKALVEHVPHDPRRVVPHPALQHEVLHDRAGLLLVQQRAAFRVHLQALYRWIRHGQFVQRSLAHLQRIEAHENLREEARAAAGHGLTHVRGDGADAEDPARRALAEEVPFVDARGVLLAHHLEVVRAHVADGELLDRCFVTPGGGGSVPITEGKNKTAGRRRQAHRLFRQYS